ncbi:MAG: creatininase family protein [Candidatus Bathyarchaeota archaeon]|nr:creatininase family protein [Candidatus Bathyarchaeota archaeon]
MSTLLEDTLYEVKGPKTLFEMSWPEVEEALAKTDVVIVPVGSVEQHGTHLPLGSDTMQATDMAKMVIKQLADEGLTICAAPTIPFGVSHAHLKFPGTITVSSETLMRVITDVCRSLHLHGFRKFMLLLGHGGNLPTLRLVANELALIMKDSKIIVPDWLPVMGAKYPEVLTSSRPRHEHHSGEGETARMVYSTPKLVSKNRGEPFYVPEELDPYAKKPYTGSVTIARSGWGMKEMTAFGVMGDPSIATAETGEKVYKVIIDWLCQVTKAELL